jgi:tetratricopeptide (TPR) repeat protein
MMHRGINKALSLLEQKYRRTFWRLTLFVIVSGIVCLGILCGLFVLWKYYSWIDAPIIIGILIVGLFPTVIILRDELVKSEKRKYNADKATVLTEITSHYSFYRRGKMFADYGFYEAALDDYNSALLELDKESEQITESLPKFFDEYNVMTKFVNGIHRPVPNIRNHDSFSSRRYYQARKNCLEKLERYDEVKIDEEKLKTIAILIEENNNLTEKYWKCYGNYD